MCGAEFFLIKDGGDLPIHLLQPVQLGDTPPNPLLIGM
jgi:hypothetical protein